MGFALVNNTQSAVQAGPITTTIPAVTAGNLIVVVGKSISTNTGITSITDNAAGGTNTYASTGLAVTDGANHRVFMWYGVAVRGGATSITVNLASADISLCSILEFSGGAATNAGVIGGTSTSTTGGGGVTSASLPSFSPTPGNLIVAAYALDVAGAVTAGSGYTLQSSSSTRAVEYRLSCTGTETCPLSWTTNSSWGGIAQEFQIAAVATVDLNVTGAVMSFAGGLFDLVQATSNGTGGGMLNRRRRRD